MITGTIVKESVHTRPESPTFNGQSSFITISLQSVPLVANKVSTKFKNDTGVANKSSTFNMVADGSFCE